MKLADKIKYFRQELNLTQDKLGKKIGVDQKQICRYETGESEPSLLALQKLADTFNITVDFLLDDSKKQFNSEFNFNDKELFIYCKTIDKMPVEIRKAVKLILKMVAFNINNKDVLDIE